MTKRTANNKKKEKQGEKQQYNKLPYYQDYQEYLRWDDVYTEHSDNDWIRCEQIIHRMDQYTDQNAQQKEIEEKEENKNRKSRQRR